MSAPTALNFAFETRDVEIRGTTFKLKELAAEQYDECVRQATGADDEIDMVTLLRLMLLESVQEPKIDAASLGHLPYTVTRQLTTAVNRLHFSDPTPAGNA